MENKQILFLDELRYETIGKYSDLEIETKLFKDYNEEFDLLKNVKDHEKSLTEDELVTFF